MVILVLLVVAANASDWPLFRGPNGSGVSTSAGNVPAEFGPSKNVAWKRAVPFGQSSPVVSGGKVFLTAAGNGKLLTLTYDARTGRELWRREIAVASHQQIYKANDPASPTPAADDSAVYAFFPDFGLVSYTLDGKDRWTHRLGPFQNFYGMAGSPIVAGNKLIQLCDQARGSFLLALDKTTGKQLWRTERRAHDIGWSTPAVLGDQLITFGTTRVDSYDISTGESRWWLPLSSNGSTGVPVFSGGNVVITASGFDSPWLPSWEATAAKLDRDRDGRLSTGECKDEKDWFEHFGWIDTDRDDTISRAEWNQARSLGTGDYGAMSIPVDGRGRLDSTKVTWRTKRNVPYIPAPLVYDGVLYMVKSGGIITAMNPATGEILRQGRTEKAMGEYYASPVATGGKIFLASAEGKLTVIKAGAQWEVLAVNDLGDECFATPAIAGESLFVRTRNTLYAFASR
jgi:hypothetical protein